MRMAVAFRKSLAFCLPALLTGLFFQLNGCTGGSQSAPQAPPAPKVTVAKPLKKKIIEWASYTGRLAALNSVEIRSRVSGYLSEKHFVDGEIVEAGQLLLTIDPKPFEAVLTEAQAQKVEAETRLAQTNAQLAQAKAMYQQSLATLDLARKRNDRTQELFRQGVSTQDELDLSTTELTEAQSKELAAKAEIKVAESGIKTAEAGIVTANAKVDTANLDLQYTKIYAPIGGRISEDYISIGNLVTAGSGADSLLTTIVSLDPIHCYFDANEREMLKYIRLHIKGERQSSKEAKNPVYMALVDEEGFPHAGHIDFVENQVDKATGSIRARAIFPNDDAILAPGMFCRLRIPGTGSYEAILLPDLAIGSEQTSQYVLTVTAENTIERKIVTTGPLSHGLRVINSGLEGDETVVINGIQRARVGQTVSIEQGEFEAKSNEGLPEEYEPVPKEKWLNQSTPTRAILPSDIERMLAPPSKAKESEVTK